MIKADNRNTRKMCEICSKLTIKTPERRQWHRSGVFIVNFEHISHLFPSVSIVVDFQQVNVSWESYTSILLFFQPINFLSWPAVAVGATVTQSVLLSLLLSSYINWTCIQIFRLIWGFFCANYSTADPN